jgi:hypothetical protein
MESLAEGGDLHGLRRGAVEILDKVENDAALVSRQEEGEVGQSGGGFDMVRDGEIQQGLLHGLNLVQHTGIAGGRGAYCHSRDGVVEDQDRFGAGLHEGGGSRRNALSRMAPISSG